MQEITVEELKEKIDNKEDFQLIDVREEHEHEFVNIGGELIPMGTIISNVDKISKDKPVIIYCRSGSRSATVARQLEQQFGFTNIYNLKGGIITYAREIDDSLPTY